MSWVDENVTVVGSPYVALTIGSATRQAAYASGSGSSSIKFRYVLASGDEDANGNGLVEDLETSYQFADSGRYARKTLQLVSDGSSGSGMPSYSGLLGHWNLNNTNWQSDAGDPPAAGEGIHADAFRAIAQRVADWLGRTV